MDFEYQGQINELAGISFRKPINRHDVYEVTINEKSTVLFREELLERIERGDFDGVSGKVVSLSQKQLEGMEVA